MRATERALLTAGIALAATLTTTRSAMAQPAVAELKIGLSSEPSSLDPHFAAVAANLALSSVLFDA